MFLNFNMYSYLNIFETSTGISLKLKRYMTYHKLDMQVKFHNSVLHFDKVMPIFKSFNLLTLILDDMSGPLYKFYTNGRIFFKIDSIVHPKCAEPILPLYQLCQRHWWGYELHSVIVLVSHEDCFWFSNYFDSYITRYFETFGGFFQTILDP